MRRLELPPGEFGAYIFDCDGTLADTMPLHYCAWSRVVGELGGRFPEKLFYELGGRPTEQIFSILRDHPFLEAARRVGIEARRCLVFEDSPLGLRAAEAAGMRWVFVPRR